MNCSWFLSELKGATSPRKLLQISDTAHGDFDEEQMSEKPFHSCHQNSLGNGASFSRPADGEERHRPQQNGVQEAKTEDFLPATDFPAAMQAVSEQATTIADAAVEISLQLGLSTYSVTENSPAATPEKRSRPNPVRWIQGPACQVQNCIADLSNAKQYYRRHKVCELHSKAPAVITGGKPQRFCQQCSRFHVLPEFDDEKRSCRKRLEDHNRRRRKSNIILTAMLPPAIAIMSGEAQRRLCMAGGSNSLRAAAEAMGSHFCLSSLGGMYLQTPSHGRSDHLSLPWLGSAGIAQPHGSHILVSPHHHKLALD